MTEGEICGCYRDAKNKREQIAILVDMAQLPSWQIVEILTRHGYEIRHRVTRRAPLKEFTNEMLNGTNKVGGQLTQKIIALDTKGLTRREIARRLGISRGMVSYHLAQTKNALDRSANPSSASKNMTTLV